MISKPLLTDSFKRSTADEAGAVVSITSTPEKKRLIAFDFETIPIGSCAVRPKHFDWVLGADVRAEIGWRPSELVVFSAGKPRAAQSQLQFPADTISWQMLRLAHDYSQLHNEGSDPD